MPMIPLHRERAAVSTQPPSAPLDSSALVATAEAISQIGGQISNIATDIQRRKNELKEKADKSDYRTQLQTLKTNIIEAKSDALQSGVPYQDIEATIVQPMLDDFQRNMAERGYSSGNLQQLQQAWAFDRASIIQSEVNDREKMEITDYTMRIRNDMWLALAEPDEERAAELRSTLAGVVGEAEANRMTSSGIYNLANEEMEAQEGIYLQDGTVGAADRYLEFLKSKETEVDESEFLAPNHKAILKTTLTSRANNLYRKEATRAASNMRTWTKEQEKGELDAEKNVILKSSMSDENYQNLMESMKESLRRKKTSDAGVRKIVETIKAYNDGDKSITEAWRDIRRSGGDFAFQGMLWLMDEVQEDVDAGEQIKAYESWFRDQKAETKGRYGDFISTMLPTLTEDSTSDEVNDFMRQARKVIQLKPDMNEKEWADAKNQILGGKAKKLIRSLPAPQLGVGIPGAGIFTGARFPPRDDETESPKSYNSVEEVDAANLPSGTIVIINGRRARVN